MVVRAIRKFSNSLTVGKDYIVLKEHENSFIIEDDEGFKMGYLKDNFEFEIEIKQTAVEWLVEKIQQAKPSFKFDALIRQAKEMEKEQIIDAIKLTIEKEYYEQTWAHCGSRNHMAEQYYNETFKSE